MVNKFDTGEGHVRSIIEAQQSLFLSFCVEDTESGGTANFVLGHGLGQLCWLCL